VAASVADRMGISKADLLSSDETNPSVKLALAETHIIAETKQYFLSAGLNIEALDPKAPRSQTIILVKNIPYGTTIPTLTELFTTHGEVKRVLLPPAGTLGVVEMIDPIEAGRAFKALSYKRLGSAVLYLEKGPSGMFVDKPQNIITEEAQELINRVSDATDAQNTDETGSTLFLKNLSFGTTTARLQSLLSSLPGYSFARVQTKPDSKRPGERLSMGYGFVGFKTREDAGRGAKGLEGFEVDGKILEVKFAMRGGEEEGEKGGKRELEGKTKGTKVLVKNLPFEATKKDVRDLFRLVCRRSILSSSSSLCASRGMILFITLSRQRDTPLQSPIAIACYDSYHPQSRFAPTLCHNPLHLLPDDEYRTLRIPDSRRITAILSFSTNHIHRSSYLPLPRFLYFLSWRYIS